MKRAVTASVLCIVGGLYLFGAWYSYRFPANFAVEHDPKVKGLAYTDTLIKVAEDMNGAWYTNKNWLPNDFPFLSPTSLLDNPQNFQLGELEALRYATRVLRDNFSRMRTTDAIDEDCETAFTAFSNDPFRFMYPRAEWKYQEGIDALKRYRTRLVSGEAKFFPRADNQQEFIKQFLSLLGGASQRLANAPRDTLDRISEETAGDPGLSGEHRVLHHTSWFAIDDEFYFVRGELYVIYHLVQAIDYDFAEILALRKADELLVSVKEILLRAQMDPWIVCNGGSGSLLANHSLQLQARLEDARQKLRSLQSVLEF